MIESGEKLLTIKELAEILNVTPQTVYLWTTGGKGPKALRVGRSIRFRRSDVNAWLDSREAW